MYNATRNFHFLTVIQRDGLNNVLHSDFSLEGDADCLVLENVSITPQALHYINDAVMTRRPRDATAAFSIALDYLRPDRGAAHTIAEACR